MTGGIELSARYHAQVVEPLLEARWPGLPRAAGRLGAGSDVLGLDDGMSRDHDWGLRLTVLVDAPLVPDVHSHLAESLPPTFEGLPARFALSGSSDVGHRVEVDSVDGFVGRRLGVPVEAEWSADDWLSFTGQAVLEVVAGPVFADTEGRLTRVRERLEWYPDDLWRWVLAADWQRLAQELPLVGRAGLVGDDVGSAVIAGRLARTVLHLCYLLERHWPPYAKWLGSRAPLGGLPGLQACLSRSLQAEDWQVREAALAEAIELVHDRQAAAGLSDAAVAVVPFWDRPFRSVADDVVPGILARIGDPDLRQRAAGGHVVGSVEQWCDSVDVLVDATRRRALAVGLQGSRG